MNFQTVFKSGVSNILGTSIRHLDQVNWENILAVVQKQFGNIVKSVLILFQFFQIGFRAHRVRITLAMLNSPLLALREI